jgi:hypothetical protein
MSIANRLEIKKGTWLASVLLLGLPFATIRAAAPSAAAPVTWLTQDQDSQEREQERLDREQEARDRAEEKRDREQEARDREQEARDRAQERIERMEELYDDGREALDDDHYEQAAAKFSALADMNGSQTDAALYWKAYAENKLGRRGSALTTIANLQRRFPQSRWQKDASALEIEVRQSTGQPPHPDAQNDDDLRLLAIRGLMNSDPERAIPLLGKVLDSPSASPKEKSQALFVIAQSGSPQARDILGKIARGQSNPDLQRKAVEYLGMFGGAQSRAVLADVYTSASDPSVKRAILRSYMIGGDKDRLFAAAKSEKDDDLRREAIRQLGLVHGVGELEQLYKAESSPDIRREILQAFFLSGDAGRLVSAAQNEKEPELRRAAVRNLGLIHSDESSKALQAIYAKETDRDTRAEVLNAFFLQNNAAALVAVARTEKDPDLKREAVQKLSLMHSKEATDYLMELLK